MKILEVKSLALPEVKVIKFARFHDHRGYFSETFRRSDFKGANPEVAAFLKNVEFSQSNESFSKAGTFRGLHFQWNPYMGKLVRAISGRLIDFALDIRKDSKNYGKIIAYEIKADQSLDYNEWIWVPVGFAHGVLLPEDSHIEYMCSGEYSPGCEAGISPLASDIDWSICDAGLKSELDTVIADTPYITDKDKNGLSLAAWAENPVSAEFTIEKCNS